MCPFEDKKFVVALQTYPHKNLENSTDFLGVVLELITSNFILSILLTILPKIPSLFTHKEQFTVATYHPVHLWDVGGNLGHLEEPL